MLVQTARAQEGEELFVDDYSMLDPSFGEPSDTMDVADGALFINLDANRWTRYFYESMVYEDLDLTVKLQIPDMTKAKGSGVGIMFWGVSVDNCYVAELYDSGTLGVRQFTPSRTLVPVMNRKVDGIKTEPNAWNELRIRIVGDLATIFVNGTEVVTLKGKPPEGGSLVGVLGETTEVKDVVRFSALKVVTPTDAPEQPASDPDVLFADDFSTLNPSLGSPSDIMYVKDNELVTDLGESQWWRLTYEDRTFDDVDATLKVKLPDMTAEQGAAVGLMFWTNSISDMYVVEISDSGTFAVRRYTGGKDLYPVLWRTTEAINQEPDQWNELRVVTHGARATIYINGQEVAKIKGHPVEAGNLIGVFAESSASGGVEARFSDLKVVPPGPSDDPAPSGDSSALLSDDFSELDPGWGVESGTFGVKDGKMFVTEAKGYGLTKLYEGDIFTGDTDGTIKVICNDGSDDSIGDVGYIFWANAYDDFWSFDLYDNGTIGVTHFLKGKWLYPMRSKAIPDDAKYDPNGTTELRVVTEGRKATLYVNGVNVGAINGQPPKEGTYLGVYVGAGDVDFTGYIDEIVVKQK